MTHSEKIESSMVEYLVGLAGDPWPATLENSDGDLRILAGESEAVKDGQCILCIMDDMQEEFPENTGNRYSMCRVELRTPVSSDDDAYEEHVAVADVLETAITEGDLASLLTAAIDDFTAMAVLDRKPIQEQTEDYWMTGWTFRLYSCPRSFS